MESDASSRLATRPTNHPQIRYFPAAPTEFRPLTATEHELARYGYPPRPDGDEYPSRFMHWHRLVSAARIIPELKELPRKAGRTLARAMTSNLSTTPNWSGIVVRDLAGTPFSKPPVSAYCTFKVPTIDQVGANDVLPDLCSIWVGIDGFQTRNADNSTSGSGDVFQAGIDIIAQIVTSSSGFGTVSKLSITAYAWIEWYPLGPQALNLPVRFGDEISVTIQYTGGNSGRFNIVNETLNQSVGLAAPPPASNIVLIGDCLEWIVERPQNPATGKYYTLADYTGATMTNCYANVGPGSTYYDPGVAPTGDLITVEMTDDGGAVISRPILGPPTMLPSGQAVHETLSFTTLPLIEE